MPGWLTDGVNQLTTLTGNELFSVDTEAAAGASPQTGAVSIFQLAQAVTYFTNNLAAGKTMVAGTRYEVSAKIGTAQTLTGIQAMIGGTGGTDKWIVELHDANGVLLATSATAGVTVGTAATFQQIPFTATYFAQPGTYWLVVQSNGTTATLATLNSPTSPVLTGSNTGTFGTGANFTPSTTYTSNLGPIASVY